MRTEGQEFNESGMTMLEVLVALILMAIAASGIFAGVRAGLTAWITAQQFTGEQQNARVVLDWSTRRLRMTGNGYAGSVPPIAVATAGEVVFYANTDGDGAVECHRVYLNAGVVHANVTELPTDCSTGTGQPISTDVEAKSLTVTSLIFQYFDGGAGAGVQLTALPLPEPDRGRVRRIQMTIGVRGFQSALSPLSMSTQVFVR